MLWFPWIALSCVIDHESPALAEVEPHARATLYPSETADAWTICDGDPPDLERLEAAIEGVFPRVDGRLWQLRQAIATELVPWVLGHGDPARDRVEARERAS